MVLNKGLSYCPQEHYDYVNTKIDFYKYTRQLKLAKIYAKDIPQDLLSCEETTSQSNEPNHDPTITIEEIPDLMTLYELSNNRETGEITEGEMLQQLNINLNQHQKSGLKKKSRYCPQLTPGNKVDIFGDAIMNEIDKIEKTRNNNKRENLTKNEREALSSLADNPHIIIKPADKGGNIVIQDTVDYVQEALRQLNETDKYSKLSKNPIQKMIRELHQKLKEWHDQSLLDEEEYQFLLKSNPTIPTAYFLPKIHKTLHNPPARPIISSCDSLYQNVSIYIDQYLAPIVHSLSSYLQDTGDFLRILANTTWQPTNLMVTIDVVSLYTSIQHSVGLKACSYFLKQRNITELNHSAMILTMIEMCLMNNIFFFNHELYHQQCGCAMGISFSPNYANLTMGWWEKEIAWGTNNQLALEKIILWT